MTVSEWNAVNKLLAHLRYFKVVSLVSNNYRQFHNDAPAYLLEKDINEVQYLLDNKETEPCQNFST